MAGLIAGRPPPAGAYDADIIILALDRVAETGAAIESALAQRGLTRHVIVLDQGSAPDTLARLAARIEGREDAMLVAAGANLGVAGGRNRASALGHGRIIAALDNDAAFDTADTLAAALAVLDAAPRLGAIGLRIVVDATGQDDLASWGYPPALLPRAGATFPAVTFVGAGHAIRRAAWVEAGGYDPALFFCWEEFDFCLRAIAAGWRIEYRGDLVVRHKVAAERRVAWNGRRWFFFVRNRLYLARKWGASWPALAPRAAGYLLRGLRNGLGGQTLRAIAAAARMPLPRPRLVMPGDGRAWLAAHDAAHRGSLAQRLWREVLAALPGRA